MWKSVQHVKTTESCGKCERVCGKRFEEENSQTVPKMEEGSVREKNMEKQSEKKRDLETNKTSVVARCHHCVDQQRSMHSVPSLRLEHEFTVKNIMSS